MYNVGFHTEITEPKIAEKEEVRVGVSAEEERQVIIHCFMYFPKGGGVRIWKSTYLRDKFSGHRSWLVNVFGVSLAPVWMLVEAGQTVHFTLTFEPLPSSCVLFDLVEDIPVQGGFFVENIVRNKEDVYRIRIE